MKLGRRRYLGLGFVAVGLVVALANPAFAPPNESVQLIRGQGSDSTVDIMQDLDRQFNNTIGCTVIGPGTSTTPKNHTCYDPPPPAAQEDPPAPGQPVDNWDHDVAFSFFALGSSNGIDMLTKQGQPGIAKIDYARSSRAPRTTDNAGLKFVGYAGDAVPWVNWRGGNATETGSPATGVDRLSLQNLKDIYLAPCTINNWSQVGGTSAPIMVWTSQRSSGERSSWDDKLIPGSSPGVAGEACIPDANRGEVGDDPAISRVIFENDASPIRNCGQGVAGPDALRCSPGDDLRSIFHTGFGAWSAAPVHGTWGQAWGADLGRMCVSHPAINTQCDGTEGSGAISVNATTIANETYVLHRQIYNVYRGPTMSNPVPVHAKDYMGEKGWICKEDTFHLLNPRTGQNYGAEITARIAAVGFVPLAVAAIGGGATGNSKCRLTNP